MAVAPSTRPISAYNIANRVMVSVRATDLVRSNKYSPPNLNNANSIMERREVFSYRGPSCSTVDFGILADNLDLPKIPIRSSDIRNGLECTDIENRGLHSSDKAEVTLHEVLVRSGLVFEALGRDGLRTYAKPDGSPVEDKDIYTSITPLGYARLCREQDPSLDALSENDFHSMLGAFEKSALTRFVKRSLVRPAVSHLLDEQYGKMFLEEISKDVFGALSTEAQTRLIKVADRHGRSFTEKFMGDFDAWNAHSILQEYPRNIPEVPLDIFKDGITFYRALPVSLRISMAQKGLGGAVFDQMTDEEAAWYLSYMCDADGYWYDTYKKCDEAFFENLGDRQKMRFIRLLPDYSRAEYFEALLD